MSAFTDRISKMKAFRSRTPASTEQIKEAESILGLTFAKEYKEYLSAFGCASIYGHEFTGICNATRLDVVNVTNEQKSFNAGIPDDWYIIEETQIDGIVIWQNAKGTVYAKSPNGSPKKIAKSFSEYIDQYS